MPKSHFNFFLLIAFIFTISFGTANAEEEQLDIKFPFQIKKIDGSTQLSKNYKKIDEIELRGVKEKLIGQVTRLFYHVPRDKTIPAEIISTYEADFKAQGFELVKGNGPYTNADKGANHYDLCGGSYNNYCGAGAATYHPHSITVKKTFADEEVYVVVTAAKADADSTWHVTPNATSTLKEKKFENGDCSVVMAIVMKKITSISLIDENINFIKAALEKDGRVNLYGILFDFNKTDLKPESQKVISEIAKLLQAEPALTLAIVGHTDNVGTAEYNQKLSEGRAAAVVSSLVTTHGIAANRLAAHGLGATQPIASNDTDEGRAKNRRVELISNKK